MIRVLQFMHSLKAGGIETFMMNVYNNIDRNNVQFDFLLTSNKKGVYEETIEKLGGNIYRIPSKREGIIKYRKKLKDFFEAHNDYSAIHINIDCLSNIDILKYAKRSGIPTIIIHSHNNNHSGLIHNVLHRINKRKVCKYATDYFTISQLASKWLFPKKIYKSKKDIIVRNGIDVKNFVFNNDTRNRIKKELKLENKKIIGHIGRFAEQKNHDFIIDIFNEVHKIKSDTVLLLIGDGPLKKNIEEKVNKLNLKNCVIFIGVKSNVYDYMQAMDVFLFPSLFEGLGRVLIEAQASDLPCIASENVIPNEARILNTYSPVSLQESPVVWAKKVIEAFNYTDRKNRIKEVEEAGFGIMTVAKQLENFYIEKSKEVK